MLKILALFAVASAEVPCSEDAARTAWCKSALNLIGKCSGSGSSRCTVNSQCFAGSGACGDTGASGDANFKGVCTDDQTCQFGQVCSSEDVPTVDNGMLKCDEPAQKLGGSTAACTLECNTNYEVETVSANKCSLSGEWEGEKGECKQKACPAVPTVTDGKLNCTDAQKLAGSPSACTLACNDKYMEKTESSYKCDANGAWMGAKGECELKVCPAVPTVTNGKLNCTDAQKLPGSTSACTLACNDKYKEKTKSAYKCDANGAWMGAKGECESAYSAALSGVAAILVAGLVSQ